MAFSIRYCEYIAVVLVDVIVVNVANFAAMCVGEATVVSFSFFYRKLCCCSGSGDGVSEGRLLGRIVDVLH